MAKCNQLTPLPFKGLMYIELNLMKLKLGSSTFYVIVRKQNRLIFHSFQGLQWTFGRQVATHNVAGNSS